MNFHGERRSNATHASTTDPEARLARKGHGYEAKLAYQGHVLMENRHGLVVETCLTQATGTAERDADRQLHRVHRRSVSLREVAPWGATSSLTLGASRGSRCPLG